MPKRSKVVLYEQIRKAHQRDGLSIHELSRRFGVATEPAKLPHRPPTVCRPLEALRPSAGLELELGSDDAARRQVEGQPRWARQPRARSVALVSKWPGPHTVRRTWPSSSAVTDRTMASAMSSTWT